MPEKIRRYELVERVGRGGMGMIYRAHDPVLDRTVALKVISPEIEVTDEIRARFYREAQACARLSHPNIVAVYDMGEEDGRLFIVMEFLEGLELKRLIAQRTRLSLEDKLALMMQVCDGLHYAHQRGVVHRDIKPGNIFRLQSGQAKILDFGIAQIASNEAGLTRTGVFMGSMRYVPPEQIAGRADHRSDIYSVGVVFYELLSLRAAFPGENLAEIVDQIRRIEPPPLMELDPTIPPNLAAVVERAMRKDPEHRFSDLEQMRVELERVQREISEGAGRLRSRLRGQLEEIQRLQATLAERVGPFAEDQTIRAFDERAGVETLQTADREFASRIDAMRRQVVLADTLAPAFQRAMDLLQAGQYADAVIQLETIVADLPEHTRAAEALRQARSHADEQRRQELAATLLRDAQTALDEGRPDYCLDILKQAEEIPPPADAGALIASLRQRAESARAAQEARRKSQQEADASREQMAQARRLALPWSAAPYEPALWNDAEAAASTAQAIFEREAFVEARQAFDTATAAYRRFEETAREAQTRERAAAEHARGQAAQHREGAHAAAAERYARETWEAAEAKLTEAQTAFEGEALAAATAAFTEALALYGKAEVAGGEARQRERRRAEDAREEASRARAHAEAASDPRYARELWDAAEGVFAEAQSIFAREAFTEATRSFAAAGAAYGRFEEVARAAQTLEQDTADRVREQAAQGRQRAQTAGAAQYALEEWEAAEAKQAEAQSAFDVRDLTRATRAFEEALGAYRRAEIAAGDARDVEKARADEAREQALQARERAQGVSGPEYSRESWEAAEAALGTAHEAFERRAYAEATPAFDAAAAGYRRYEESVLEAQGRDRDAAERGREQAAQGRGRAQGAAAEQYARESWEAAEAKSAEAGTAFAEKAFRRANEVFNEAAILYRRAGQHAAEARRREHRRAEEARNRIAQGQRDAGAVDAEHLASALWTEASAKSTEAESDFQEERYAKAAETFESALVLYRRSENQAREVQQRLREQAEQARQAMAERRSAALAADSPSHALSDWNEAEAAAAAGESVFKLRGYEAARRGFDEAVALYRRAEERAAEAAQALEIARAEVDKAHQATTRARQAAVEAEAPKRAVAQWQAGEAKQSQATEALNRQEYAAARALFGEAGRLYTQAARAASVAVETETRRADAKMSEARRLFESQDYAACIRRLDEVLALKSDHAAASSLQEQARSKLRQVEEAREQAKTRAREETGGQKETATTASTVAEPSSKETNGRAGASVVQSTAEELGTLTSQTSATIWAEPKRFAGGSASSRADAPPIPLPAWPWRRIRPFAFGLGGLVAILLLIAYVLPRTPAVDPIRAPSPDKQTPTVTAPPPVVISTPPAVTPPPTDATVVAAVRMVESQVTEARASASLVDAPRLAPEPWAKGERAARDADEALKQRAFDRVLALRFDAIKFYREAGDTATRVASKPPEGSTAAVVRDKELEQAKQSQTAAEKARQEAQRVAASNLASRTYALAREKETAGITSLRRQDAATARVRFQEAQEAYTQAAQEAVAEKQRRDLAEQAEKQRVAASDQTEKQRLAALEQQRAAATQQQREAALQRQQSLAEQARDRMTAAKKAADQARAGQFAAKLNGAAHQKEVEATAAFQRPDYDLAVRLFADAEADYQSAKREAEMLGASLDQSMRRMNGRRDEAVKAEAARFAKEQFDAAQAKQAEAEGLVRASNLVAAAQAFQDAAERYVESAVRAGVTRDAMVATAKAQTDTRPRDDEAAKIRAQAKLQADGAKALMLKEKDKADRALKEFTEAVGFEKEGDSLYERLEFKDAVDRFQQAEKLFGKARKKASFPSPS